MIIDTEVVVVVVVLVVVVVVVVVVVGKVIFVGTNLLIVCIRAIFETSELFRGLINVTVAFVAINESVVDSTLLFDDNGNAEKLLINFSIDSLEENAIAQLFTFIIKRI